jgi:hypothetical protein
MDQDLGEQRFAANGVGRIEPTGAADHEAPQEPVRRYASGQSAVERML